ncbi:hypothetical protein [Deinococcus sp. QL22]|uniref:hypothetical protein n=1 Tax=Deinococcus sp. QL22 TaxID=2939437 RepID=UPI002016F6E2|nr:hypothetical protein [Deinococcus sp. QL22]UQN07999.1 hypothetical protein M1R55_18060 [Deinococcus sp. QL22]
MDKDKREGPDLERREGWAGSFICPPTSLSDGGESPALRLQDMSSQILHVHLEQLKQDLEQHLPANCTVYVEGWPAEKPDVVTVTVKTYQVDTAMLGGVELPFVALKWEQKTQQQVTEDVDAIVQAELVRGLPPKGAESFTRRTLH